jgi:CheY-like chemotaxis protein/anti-sigma regulatory factor (Ser/Thr protein kinase)
VESQHVLEAHKAAGALLVDGDRARVAQAVVNLLSNAVKYTERGGRITLRTRREGPEAVLSVADSGIGIAPARLETVFEMFSQEEAALSRSRGGVGIGLALTRKLVEMHGGRVRATSEGPGMGSEFEIAFPLAPGIAEATRPSVTPSGEPGTTSLRILIADDNKDAADTLRMLLEVMGHSVVQVPDGESAVRAATDFDPQLVLLDIGMPKLNGYEACERIRNSPGGATRFVAAITGWGQPQDVTAASDAGFDRHVTKPIAMEALSQHIERAAVGATHPTAVS